MLRVLFARETFLYFSSLRPRCCSNQSLGKAVRIRDFICGFCLQSTLEQVEKHTKNTLMNNRKDLQVGKYKTRKGQQTLTCVL
jgi:hypothetical protein